MNTGNRSAVGRRLRRVMTKTMPWAISLGLLWLVLDQSDWGEIAEAAGKTKLPVLFFDMILHIFAHGVAGLRWRGLLASIHVVRRWHAACLVFTGNFANIILPLRGGDIARAILIGRVYPIPASSAFATVVVEKLLDLLTLFTVILLVAFLHALPSEVIEALYLSAAGVAVITAGIVLIAIRPSLMNGFASWLSRFLPKAIGALVIRVSERFAGALSVVGNWRLMLRSWIFTLGFWILSALSISFIIAAFDIPAPWYAALYVLALTNLGFAVPSSPSAIGVYHFLAAVAISAWVPDSSTAAAFALVSHGVLVISGVAAGIVGITALGFGRREVFSAANAGKTLDPENRLIDTGSQFRNPGH